MKLTTPLFAATVLLCSLALLEARTWTQSASGKKIEAEYIGVDGPNVQLKMGSKIFTVPISRLSVDDHAFIQSKLATSQAAEWPQHRGPNQDDISPDTGLLKEWPEGGPDKLWTFDEAGIGYSGVVVSGGKLFSLGTQGDKLTAFAIDAKTGEPVWSTAFGGDDQQGYNARWGHGPRSSPTVNDGKVYALGPKGTLACFDAGDGSLKWSKNMSEFSAKSGSWGFSESPLVDGDLVVVAPGGSTDSLVALNKNTGEKVWGADISGVGKAEYATVVVAEMDGKRQYIKFFDTVIAGVDAEDGTELWKSDWGGKIAVIPTPIVDGNKVHITSGYGAGSKLIRVSGSETEDLWTQNKMEVHHGGTVKIGDYVYGLSNPGAMICQSWETGEVVWADRTPGKGAIHAADGMLYCLGERDGTIHLVEASPEGYSERGKFTLDPQSSNRNQQGRVWTHPVVIGGKLYLRDQEYISCYNVKAMVKP